MKYKTIMLDANTHARLLSAKRLTEERIGSRISFVDLLIDLMGRRVDLLPIDKRLKILINRFSTLLIESGTVSGILLFGSIARGKYDVFSDIDFLLVSKGNKERVLERTFSIKKTLESERETLMKEDLPSLINPLILSEKDLKSFRPFYFDLADYGIVIYEDDSVLTDFIYSTKYTKHKRFTINGTEVLTW